MKLFASLLVIAFSTSALATENFAKKVDNKVYVRVVEMTNALDNRVLIVGTIHYAPQAFYDRAAEVMYAWSAQSRVKILKEFSTCETEVYDQTRSEIPAASFEAAAIAISAIAPRDFVKRTEASISPIIEKLELKKSACVLDVDGKTKRPAYLVDRNRNWCAKAPSEARACQWLGLRYPSSPNVTSVEADTIMDQATAALQLVGVQMYRGWNVEASDETYNKYGTPVNYVIIDYRNAKLADHVLRAFADGTEKVIVPCGAAHTSGMVTLLRARGFRETKSQDLLFMSADDPGASTDPVFNNPLLNEHY